MNHALEQQLLNAAARLQRGDTSAATDMIEALKQVAAHHHKLAPLVGSLLQCSPSDVQVHACNTLARMGKGASSETERLVELLKKDEFPASGAAACALGRIPSAESVRALTLALEHYSPNILSFVAMGLRDLGEMAVPALRALDRMARKVPCEVTKQVLEEAAAAIRLSARIEHTEATLAFPAFEYLDIRSWVAREDSRAAYYAPHAIELDQSATGLLYSDRFRFIMSDRSECGLRIYRAEQGEIFVIFSVDGESYGMSPTNAAENLATAVLHIFNLDPTKITWLERYAKSSGQEQETCDFVHLEFDPVAKVYSDPRWQRVNAASTAEHLRSFGIEW